MGRWSSTRVLSSGEDVCVVSYASVVGILGLLQPRAHALWVRLVDWELGVGVELSNLVNSEVKGSGAVGAVVGGIVGEGGGDG